MKRKQFRPIIIAGVIVLAFIVAFFVFTSFFNSSIVGTWVICEDSNGATYDEAGDGTYYTLDKDGNITVSVGTITQNQLIQQQAKTVLIM